jgi:hypothetical protein
MRKSGLHDLVEGDGEVADAFAVGVVDGDGGSGDADFADASRSQRLMVHDRRSTTSQYT